MSELVEKAEAYLSSNDPVMKKLIDRHGPCTITDGKGSHYHYLVHAIINQQLSVKAAASIEAKLQTHLNATHYQPDSVLACSFDELRACGLSGSKVQYVKNIAEHINSGELDLDDLDGMSDTEISSKLMVIKGIGQWTADMFLMFSLKRPDVLPVGDLALRRAMQQLYGIKEDAQHKRYRTAAKPWQPYRSIASWYCWAHVD